MVEAPWGSPAHGNDNSRHRGHAGTGLVESDGREARFPAQNAQQFTSRYEAKLERMRTNNDRVMAGTIHL